MYYVHMFSPRYYAEIDNNVRTPSDEEGVDIIAASSTTSLKMALIRPSLHSSLCSIWYGRATIVAKRIVLHSRRSLHIGGHETTRRPKLAGADEPEGE